MRLDKKSWYLSIGIHLIFVLSFVATSQWTTKVTQVRTFKVKMTEKKVVKQKIKPKELKPVEIKTQKKPPAPPKKKKIVKRVFGIKKKSLQNKSDSSAPKIKLGNTVAKAPDTVKMTDDIVEDLPEPTEEYLVSVMPQLVSEVQIEYPEEARKKQIEGSVLMEILIDEQGKVRWAKLVSGPGYGLNQAALQAIYRFQFSPARVGDKPVAVQIKYSYRFVLE